jgi:hypothetical protein
MRGNRQGVRWHAGQFRYAEQLGPTLSVCFLKRHFFVFKYNRKADHSYPFLDFNSARRQDCFLEARANSINWFEKQKLTNTNQKRRKNSLYYREDFLQNDSRHPQFVSILSVDFVPVRWF